MLKLFYSSTAIGHRLTRISWKRKKGIPLKSRIYDNIDDSVDENDRLKPLTTCPQSANDLTNLWVRTTLHRIWERCVMVSVQNIERAVELYNVHGGEHLVSGYKGNYCHLAGQLSLQMSSLLALSVKHVLRSQFLNCCKLSGNTSSIGTRASTCNSWVILTDVPVAIKLSPPETLWTPCPIIAKCKKTQKSIVWIFR